MKRQQIVKQNMPDSPGIYIFRDYRKRPMYIGRATSLNDRVKSYFSYDLIETRGPRIVDMVTKAKSLTWQVTGSVLEAILLESNLIKRYQPFYNVDERDDKSSQYVVITDEPWPRIFLERVRTFDQTKDQNQLPYKVLRYFGPFTEIGLIKEAMRIMRKLFPFRDRKSRDPRHEEFYRSIGRSPQNTDEKSHEEYLKTIKHLILFFESKSDKLIKTIEKEMNANAKLLRFEKAEENRRLLFALKHINDMALLKRHANNSDGVNDPSRSFRIECFDIAHLSGTNVVGVMAVNINGESAKSEYRKFYLSKQVNDDLLGLMEIVSRRLNHSEWAYPDLIVVDGSENHVKVVESILKSRRINIPVVAVTKDDRHKASRFIGSADLIEKYKNEIIAVNAEAHRFAITYHRQKRKIKIT
ncbi:MAG: hypothetical protein WC648_00725 [Candidatus Paceibacterota bacterium]|jgi:excinuclease ABC subunit C